MSANYDRLCDMAGTPFQGPITVTFSNVLPIKAMRGTGVEPVSLSAPDPKSDSAPLTGHSPECEAPPSATEIAPSATQSATKSTTCAETLGGVA